MAGESGVTGLFESAEAAPPAEMGRVDVNLHAGVNEPISAAKPEWLDATFWRQDPADPSKGEVLTESMHKSWRDTKAKLTQTEQTLAELRRQGGGSKETVPGSITDYLTGLDFEGLKKVAPRADFSKGAEGEHAKAFFEAARRAGLGVESARKAYSEFWSGLNPGLPEVLSDEDRRKAAVAHLGPNGQQQFSDVRAWVEGLNSQAELTPEQNSFLRDALSDPGGLAFLWRLQRQAGSGAPPSTDANGVSGGSDVLTKDELEKIWNSDRYLMDPEYQERVDAAARRTLGERGQVQRSVGPLM